MYKNYYKLSCLLKIYFFIHFIYQYLILKHIFILCYKLHLIKDYLEIYHLVKISLQKYFILSI